MSTNEVKVYSTTWCGFCRMAKQYLASKNIAFTEVDIEKDQTAAMYILDKTGQAGVPVIEIGEETILGFDRAKIDDALRAAKLVS